MKNRTFFLAGLVLTVLIFLAFPAAGRAQAVKTSLLSARATTFDIPSLEREVFRLVNQTRENKGLGKLVWSGDVARLARLHSNEMAANNYFSHLGLDGKKVSDRADSIGLRQWQLIGENIAFSAGSEDPVMRAVLSWMNSAGHRRNILRDGWKETGIGVAVTPQGKFFITQVFLKRK